MPKSTILSRIVGAAVAVTVVSTGLPAFADEANTVSWFAAQKAVLRQKLESAPPVTFKFIGDRIVPVFVKQAPKFIVLVEAVGPVTGGATARVLR